MKKKNTENVGPIWAPAIQNISLAVLAVSAGFRESVSGKTEPGFGMKYLAREVLNLIGVSGKRRPGLGLHYL